jgi:hypothetical protein
MVSSEPPRHLPEANSRPRSVQRKLRARCTSGSFLTFSHKWAALSPPLDSIPHCPTDLPVHLCHGSACLLPVPLLRQLSPCCWTYQIKCRVVKFAFCPPSLLWGFLTSKGVRWRYTTLGCAQLVLPSARREVVVSNNSQVKLSPPPSTLSPCPARRALPPSRTYDVWHRYSSAPVELARTLLGRSLLCHR